MQYFADHYGPLEGRQWPSLGKTALEDLTLLKVQLSPQLIYRKAPDSQNNTIAET